MKSVLITGANGFIGKSLTKRLVKKGYVVEALPRELLYDLEGLKIFVKEKNPTEIYHFASYGNMHSQTDEELVIRANVLGVFNLLQATKDIDYSVLISTGSSSEYGRKSKPMNEHDSVEPNTLYGAAKVAATVLSGFFAQKYTKPIVTVRPFSVYGPGDASEHFIPTAIKSFMTGSELSLAPGVHDWIYIDDFISGVLEVSKNAEKLSGKIVNIGIGVQVSNQEVVDLLREIFGKSGNVREVGQVRSYDTTMSWVADNSLLRGLGWEPKVDLKVGLERSIDAY